MGRVLPIPYPNISARIPHLYRATRHCDAGHSARVRFRLNFGTAFAHPWAPSFFFEALGHLALRACYGGSIYAA